MSWQAKSQKAGRVVDLAHTYWEDGAFWSAAQRLRAAADLLEEAAKERDHLLEARS